MDTVNEDVMFLMESLAKLQKDLLVLFTHYDVKFQNLESKLRELEIPKTTQYH